MRTTKEIEKEIDILFDKVWYERKLVMFSNIQDGEESMPDPTVYSEIIKQMDRIKKEMNYSGIKDDFGWGMINGKLSALRWVMGDEWDNLDT